MLAIKASPTPAYSGHLPDLVVDTENLRGLAEAVTALADTVGDTRDRLSKYQVIQAIEGATGVEPPAGALSPGPNTAYGFVPGLLVAPMAAAEFHEGRSTYLGLDILALVQFGLLTLTLTGMLLSALKALPRSWREYIDGEGVIIPPNEIARRTPRRSRIARLRTRGEGGQPHE